MDSDVNPSETARALSVPVHVLRATLLAVLAGTLVLSLVSVITLLTQSNDCLGAWRELPRCQKILTHLAVPGWHEAVIAVFAALSSVGGYVMAVLPPLHGYPFGRVPRRRLVQPVAPALLLAVGTSILDPATDAGLPLVMVTLLFYAVWVSVRWVTDVLAELGIRNMEAVLVTPANRLVTRILLALGSTFVAAGIVIRFGAQPDMPRVNASWILAAVISFAVSALTLLMHVRYSEIRQEWSARQVSVAPSVRRQWLRYSPFTVGLAVVLAFALPVTLILTTLLQPLGAVGGPAVDALSRLAVPTPTPVPGGHKRPPQGIDIAGHAGHHRHVLGTRGVDWFSVLGHALIWVLAILVIGTLLWHVGVVPRWLGFILRLWIAIRRRSRAFAVAVTDRLPASVADRMTLASTGRFSRQELTSSEQVQRYYVNVVKYAGRHGAVRRPAQTPKQFEDELRSLVPEQHHDLDALTRAFVEARYSTAPIEQERLTTVHASWRRVRAALRRARPPAHE
jgi:Domain of unknown function (DUF4129)